MIAREWRSSAARSSRGTSAVRNVRGASVRLHRSRKGLPFQPGSLPTAALQQPGRKPNKISAGFPNAVRRLRKISIQLKTAIIDRN